MSNTAILEQIQTVKEVTSQAAKNKESALAFLSKAGLLKKGTLGKKGRTQTTKK